MKIEKIKEFKSEISYLDVNSNGTGIVDRENRVYVFDGEFKLKRGFKIKLPENKIKENNVKLSPDFKYLLLAVNGKPLTFWDVENKKLLKSFNWHRGDVLSVGFGNGYFASGGIDGKIYLYSTELREMVSKLAKHKDFISDIALGEENVYAVSFDKAVLSVNMSSLQKYTRYLHLKKALKIDNKHFLVSASELSDVIKWDKDKLDDIDRFDMYKEFRDFCIFENYLFIAVKEKIVLYDLEKEVLINENFLSESADKISVYDNRLYFSSSNILNSVNLADEEEILNAVLAENYKLAYEMVGDNPFLKNTKTYKKLEEIYKNTIKKAMKYFEEDLKSQAYEILKPFMSVLVKREEISNLIKSYENIIKFKHAYQKKNYPLFYQIANMYPMLKETKYYKLVEHEWQMKFEKAKVLALSGKVSEAEELLKNFTAVPEKTALIKLLLQEAGLFKLLKEKIAKKDFKGFFAIIKEHPELKDSKEYKSVMEYADKLYEKALKALENEDFKLAMKISEILEDIEGYEIKAKEITQYASAALEFLQLFNEDKNKAFKMIERYPFLKKLKVYKVYEERWKQKLQSAERKAFAGSIKDALKELKEYEYINVKRPRIKNMLKSAYLKYIALTKDKKAIDKYIKTFGKDEEIQKFVG